MRQGRGHLAGLGHQLDNLSESFDIDFPLLGDDTPIRVKIERHDLARESSDEPVVSMTTRTISSRLASSLMKRYADASART